MEPKPVRIGGSAFTNPRSRRSRPQLIVDRTTDRADAELGPAEFQMVWTIGPVRGADAEHILAVRRFHSAHRVVAALAGLQAGKIVSTLGRLLEYFRRNAEHYVNSPSPVFLNFDLPSGRPY